MSDTKGPATRPADAEDTVRTVRDRYARFARDEGRGCCDRGEFGAQAARLGYDAGELASIPGSANLGLGCGAPVEALDPRPGETVLDLGSGPGLDAVLAARRVGPSGRVIGVDMTPEMIRRAGEAAARAGLGNVEFLEGRLERLPVDDASVDAVTSNCVINLVPDKSAVFREIARVLRPGGRLVISDIVLDGDLPESVERSLLAYVGCVAGAARREVYFDRVRAAGLVDVEVLRQSDFVAVMAESPPEDVAGWLRETGCSLDDLAGIVMSVTFRARKP